jgi:3-deoxy-7-phosphoheptulonate synthase
MFFVNQPQLLEERECDMNQTMNVRIHSMKPLPTFNQLAAFVPLSARAEQTVLEAQRVIPKILSGEDKRMLVVVGPCSIHDLRSARAYAQKLADLHRALVDRLYIVMRVCGDKPRTGKDWEGFFNDPHMNNSCDIAYGRQGMRHLMQDVNALGLPVGAEVLEADNTHCTSDLLGYAWVGARTVQSPDHRKLASGLTAPVGFKNPTHGPIDAAIAAILFARHSSCFSGPDGNGVMCRIETTGNPSAHLIMRGTDSGPNYADDHLTHAQEKLEAGSIGTGIVVDCSHKNAQGDYRNQKAVLKSVAVSRKAGKKIVGVMIESYLQEGRQSIKIPQDMGSVDPNVSVTDACCGWGDTVAMLRMLYASI